MTDIVVSPESAKKVYWCTYLGLINIAYTYYYRLYIPFCLYIVMLMTSLNYWKQPRYDINRVIDISWIVLFNTYQYGYCHQIEDYYYYLYNLLLILTAILYFLGIYNLSNEYVSINYHLSCHITAHIAYYCLYIGLTLITKSNTEDIM